MHARTTQTPRRLAGLRIALLTLGVGLALAGVGQAQGRRGGAPAAPAGPWFGLPTPPPLGAEPAVLVGPRAPRPYVGPSGETRSPELMGSALLADVETIVAISKESRASREVGSGQVWGRISGLPSGAKAIDWAIDGFRRAGIQDVRDQPIVQDANSSFWFPLSWEVRILGDPAFGPGSNDVILTSALPLSPTDIPGGTMTAPLVYVGTASPAIIEHIDVRGKIAVQLIVPQGHMVFERGDVSSRARALLDKGAIGVFNLVRLPGNEYARDFSNCGNPCVNIGGHDGHFLESLLDRAAEAGVSDKVRARITLQTENRTGLTAHNGVAVIPGRGTSGETIVIDAHADAWFDGAGDNADGYAVMMGLARHFAKPENRPERTFVFVASAGHHSPGMNGPRSFVEANPELASKAVLVINIEHVAQRNFSAARSVSPDGYREAVADSGEAPITAGVSNASPFLDELLAQGVLRYGANFVSEPSSMQSGETGGFGSIDKARITLMQAPPLYHTTGEVFDVISEPGLERMGRFLVYFLKEADKAPASRINP